MGHKTSPHNHDMCCRSGNPQTAYEQGLRWWKASHHTGSRVGLCACMASCGTPLLCDRPIEAACITANCYPLFALANIQFETLKLPNLTCRCLQKRPLNTEMAVCECKRGPAVPAQLRGGTAGDSQRIADVSCMVPLSCRNACRPAKEQLHITLLACGAGGRGGRGRGSGGVRVGAHQWPDLAHMLFKTVARLLD